MLIVALAAAALVPADAPRRMPPEAHMAPPRAVDHVAVMIVNRGYGPPGEDRHVVTRSGSWIREERMSQGGAATYHSDLASGVTFAYSRDPSGRYRSLSVNRHSAADTYHLFRRTRTGERDRALGEDCEVWSTVRAGEAQGGGINWLSCETADGIQLWSRAVSVRTGEDLNSSRTVEFHRRPVRPGEVRPPRDLLRWAYWRGLTAEGGAFSGGRQHPDHELRLARDDDASRERARIIRRSGDWSYADSTGADGARRVHIDNRVISVSYEAEASGRPVLLQIYLLPPGRAQAAGPIGYERIEPARSERVIGETCFWSRPSAGGGIVVVSGEHRDCVTADGLALRTFSSHYGVDSSLTATRLIRRRPPMSALMPPHEGFDWARWGVDQLPD